MKYSIEPREQIYVRDYGHLSFTKNKGKNLKRKYGQKLLTVQEVSNRCTQNSFKKSDPKNSRNSRWAKWKNIV